MRRLLLVIAVAAVLVGCRPSESAYIAACERFFAHGMSCRPPNEFQPPLPSTELCRNEWHHMESQSAACARFLLAFYKCVAESPCAQRNVWPRCERQLFAVNSFCDRDF